MSSEREQLLQIKEAAADLARVSAGAAQVRARLKQKTLAERDARYMLAHAAFEERIDDARQVYREVKEASLRTLTEVTDRAGPSALPWSDAYWTSLDIARNVEIPTVTRMGELVEHRLGPEYSFPALVPIIGSGSLLIEAQGSAKDKATAALQSVMLRLLATMPAGKLRFLLLDPVGLGQSVAGFLRLDEYSTGMINERAWTEPAHIEQRLANISEHMETVIGKYLRNQYPDMEAYNRAAGEVAEPYRVVVAVNFPAAFTENAARRLTSIAANGPKCGVHVLAMVDKAQPLPYGFNLSELERLCHVVSAEDEGFVWWDLMFQGCSLTLDEPADKELFDAVIDKAGAAAANASTVRVPYDKIIELSDEWWTNSTATELTVPIGRAGATQIQQLTFGKGTAQHALLAGKTGSGKSTLIHVIIASLVIRYAPSEIQLYLVDFKKGVEFKEYATGRLPHARVIAIESEREFGLSVLHGLDAELKERGESFRAVGANNITEYRQRTGDVLPRILLIVDEFQEFFSEDDALAGESSLLLDRLVRQGRAFGMHVLLGSQTLAGAYSLTRSTVDQMAVRIALQCSDADSRLILSDDNGAARLLTREGEAIYNDENGLYEGNRLFQVAWLDDVQRGDIIRRARELVVDVSDGATSPIVFEGNEPADVYENRQLTAALQSTDPAPAKPPYLTWLGEPVSIRESEAAFLRRQAGSNLLITGNNERLATGMLTVASVGLLAQHRASLVSFTHLDFLSPDNGWSDSVKKVVALKPQASAYGRRRELEALIGREYEALQVRLANPDNAPADERYIFIWGLQRARDLRPSDELGYSNWDDDEPGLTVAQKLVEIVREGPDLGIHVIAWCDTVSNLGRVFQRQEINEFDLRVALQMNGDDSLNFLDSPLANNLGPHRACLLDDYAGTLTKFRPYAPPPEEWLIMVTDLMGATDAQLSERE